MSAATPLQVALVEDDMTLRDATLQALTLEGAEVVPFPDARAALGWLTVDYPGVVVSDVRMPGIDGIAFFAALREIDPELPVILTTGHGDIAMAVEAMKNGAADFLTKPYSSVDLIRAVRAAADRRMLALENRALREEAGRSAGAAVPGSSPAAVRLRSVIEGVARSEIDVVLTGEAGTGKSHAAQAIHDLSPRRSRPFVTVDAGILAHEDAELLLFGRDPAAGLSRTGLVERANGGTLFIDEIEVAHGALRARLLSLLEKRSVLPIGADRARRLNIRIIIARLADGTEPTGRDPLWHRLGAVQIALPALSERREDLPELFRVFVARHARSLDLDAPAIGEAQWRHVLSHDWPGNLHELSGYARAFVLGLADSEVPGLELAGQRPLHQIVAEFERTVLEDGLRQCRGDITQLQAMLRTPRKTLYDKLAKHDLKPAHFRRGGD
ncbi:sigma-54-dependent transcriptional regulator [Erythrobacter dokdonensis]|uniref:C4-dicarboxylate transport transcriptional regulatory protein dctD n=1 Tax=Erythrobacter dokdonensis DSW-74 TaxID=1300349 RepID=A0A1A7BBU1_9SPHN|nr:sigma-54 dependent transcriptional regulator [Erythrobacter dokdonensis]OBV09988.1 C4-dicarboxylate transport transcriptional regulatory protein dctD [Erythrobacter dokdonensis DSW-74]